MVVTQVTGHTKQSKGQPNARGSRHCGVYGGSDVRGLTSTHGEAVSVFEVNVIFFLLIK